jgi:hypothetical protein
MYVYVYMYVHVTREIESVLPIHLHTYARLHASGYLTPRYSGTEALASVTWSPSRLAIRSHRRIDTVHSVNHSVPWSDGAHGHSSTYLT